MPIYRTCKTSHIFINHVPPGPSSEVVYKFKYDRCSRWYNRRDYVVFGHGSVTVLIQSRVQVPSEIPTHPPMKRKIVFFLVICYK